MSDELIQIRLPGRATWRGLDELRGPVLDEDEHPGDEPTSLSRRGFLQLLGASAALAGLDGCGRDVPPHILPHAISPPGQQPGVSRFYATAMLQDGFATGLLARSID